MMHTTGLGWVGWLGILCAVCALGCGGLPVPAPATPPVSQFERVPYPPPPGRVEELVSAPREDLVWVDGTWSWQGTRYRWQRGGWYERSAGVAYAPSQLRINRDGSFDYAMGGWLTESGVLVDPPPLAYGVASDDDIVDEIGNEVDVGPTAPPE